MYKRVLGAPARAMARRAFSTTAVAQVSVAGESARERVKEEEMPRRENIPPSALASDAPRPPHAAHVRRRTWCLCAARGRPLSFRAASSTTTWPTTCRCGTVVDAQTRPARPRVVACPRAVLRAAARGSTGASRSICGGPMRAVVCSREGWRAGAQARGSLVRWNRRSVR
jgi:hypothetical protein